MPQPRSGPVRTLSGAKRQAVLAAKKGDRAGTSRCERKEAAAHGQMCQHLVDVAFVGGDGGDHASQAQEDADQCQRPANHHPDPADQLAEADQLGQALGIRQPHRGQHGHQLCLAATQLHGPPNDECAAHGQPRDKYGDIKH